MDSVPDTCTMTNTHTPSKIVGFHMQLADFQYIAAAAKRIDSQEFIFNSADCCPSVQELQSMELYKVEEFDELLKYLIENAKSATKRTLTHIYRTTIVTL